VDRFDREGAAAIRDRLARSQPPGTPRTAALGQ
jgi:hypothetical protein